jgi:hypothetical protein
MTTVWPKVELVFDLTSHGRRSLSPSGLSISEHVDPSHGASGAKKPATEAAGFDVGF